MLQPSRWSYFSPRAVAPQQSEQGGCRGMSWDPGERLELASASQEAPRDRLEIRCFLVEKTCCNTRVLARTQGECILCLFLAHTHTHTQIHTAMVAPAIYSHLSHTGKRIHVLRVPISLLCLSIFSHTHSPKQSPSITTSPRVSPSLSLFISPSSTVNHSFPLPPHLPLALPTYISLLYHPLPRLFLSLSFSASHSSPGVFLGDQSSSSQRCHTIGSSQNTHTHTCAHAFSVMCGQQMPRFTYDYSKGAHAVKEKKKPTHARMQTYTQTHTITCAHHLLAVFYNEMEDVFCQRRDGVTLWLRSAGSDPVTCSSSSSQPTLPPPSPGPERRAQSGLEGWSWKLCSGLHSLRQAPSHSPTPPPEHDQILALRRPRQRVCVCVCVLLHLNL